MIYGCICLALYDDLQDRVIEEIDRVYEESEKAGRTHLSYEEDYPKLTYTLCFMVSSALPPAPNKSPSLLTDFPNAISRSS